jgi:hypothetical protein
VRNDARPIGHENSHQSPVVGHQSPAVGPQSEGADRQVTRRRERQTHALNRPADEGGQLEPDEERRSERGHE